MQYIEEMWVNEYDPTETYSPSQQPFEESSFIPSDFIDFEEIGFEHYANKHGGVE